MSRRRWCRTVCVLVGQLILPAKILARADFAKKMCTGLWWHNFSSERSRLQQTTLWRPSEDAEDFEDVEDPEDEAEVVEALEAVEEVGVVGSLASLLHEWLKRLKTGAYNEGIESNAPDNS